MNCEDARAHLLPRRRGALAPGLSADVEAHLAGCERCQAEDAADAQLDVLLAERLARPRAPRSLRAAVSRQAAAPRRALATPFAAAVLGLGLAAGVALGVFVAARRPPVAEARDDAMVAEAINDHLRVLYSSRPLEVESGGIHQVKPWFTGRLDFAPLVSFSGDEDFPLQGGAVGYYLDRKAATLVFKRRLHTVSVFVFRADGLPWPTTSSPDGSSQVIAETSRGFHVLLVRSGDLGYALVSDVDGRDLELLASRIRGG